MLYFLNRCGLYWLINGVAVGHVDRWPVGEIWNPAEVMLLSAVSVASGLWAWELCLMGEWSVCLILSSSILSLSLLFSLYMPLSVSYTNFESLVDCLLKSSLGFTQSGSLSVAGKEI